MSCTFPVSGTAACPGIFSVAVAVNPRVGVNTSGAKVMNGRSSFGTTPSGTAASIRPESSDSASPRNPARNPRASTF